MANRTGPEQGIGAIPRRYIDVPGDESWFAEAVASVVVGADGATVVDADQGNADGVAATKKGQWANARGYLWNGATWDRAPGNASGQFMQGNVGHGVADAGNPNKIGGVGSSAVPTAVTAGQRVNAWYGLNGQAVVALGAGSVNDGATASPLYSIDQSGNSRLLGVGGYGFTGATWDRLRAANVFKTLSAVVITSETTIWTPAGGKKFRLMGMLITQGVVTGAITLKDNTAGTTIAIIPPHTIAVAMPLILFGNGILSAAANNVLTATGASTETITGTIFGTEE